MPLPAWGKRDPMEFCGFDGRIGGGIFNVFFFVVIVVVVGSLSLSTSTTATATASPVVLRKQ